MIWVSRARLSSRAAGSQYSISTGPTRPIARWGTRAEDRLRHVHERGAVERVQRRVSVRTHRGEHRRSSFGSTSSQTNAVRQRFPSGRVALAIDGRDEIRP